MPPTPSPSPSPVASPAEIELRVGGRVHQVPGQLTIDSTVSVLDPPHGLEYGWHGRSNEEAKVRWELTPHGGGTRLVAPYRAVSWVHNARASGRVTLGRRGDRRDRAVCEVSAGEAGPVLKRYGGVATATRPYLQADKDAPVEDFAAEADRHPAFELLPIDEDRPDDG